MIGFVLSVIFLYFAFRGIDFKGVIGRILRVEVGWLVVGTCFFLLSYVIKGWRWQIILNPIKRIKLFDAVGGMVVNLWGNNLFPLRFGEIIRVISLNHRSGIPNGAIVTSIILERLLDSLGLVFYLFIAFILGGNKLPDILRKGGLFLLITGIGGLIIIFVLQKHHHKISLPKPFENLMKNAMSGLKIVTNIKEFFCISFITLLGWFTEILSYNFYALAFSLKWNWIFGIVILCVVNIWALLPSSPGYIGVFEHAMVVGFALNNLPKEMAVSYGIIVHFLRYITMVIGGFIVFAIWGIKPKEIEKEAEEKKEVLKDEKS